MTNLSQLLAYQKEVNIKSTLPERQLAGRLRSIGMRVKVQTIIGPFIVDLLVARKMLIIEVDGPIHNSEKAKRYDAQRTAYLSGLGFKVTRVKNEDVKGTEILRRVESFPDAASYKRCRKIIQQTLRGRNWPSAVMAYGPSGGDLPW